MILIYEGISSKKDNPRPISTRTPASTDLPPPVKAKDIEPPRALGLASPAMPSKTQRGLSYIERREKWINDSAHVHDGDSMRLAERRLTDFEKKFNLSSGGRLISKVAARNNYQLIFLNRGRGLDLHICPYSGVAIGKLVDQNQSGTFYFQEGKIISVEKLKSSPFCSVTLRKKINFKEKPIYHSSVLEKKADFRFLPKFTGVRHVFDQYLKNQVIAETACYTPVFDPKKTEYDTLTERDMAFAFHAILDF